MEEREPVEPDLDDEDEEDEEADPVIAADDTGMVQQQRVITEAEDRPV